MMLWHRYVMTARRRGNDDCDRESGQGARRKQGALLTRSAAAATCAADYLRGDYLRGDYLRGGFCAATTCAGTTCAGTTCAGTTCAGGAELEIGLITGEQLKLVARG